MLERNSNEAAKRFAQARHLFERCLVVSFFETASYGKTTGIVVNKDSATLNLPGSVEKQVALDADHSAICKFDSDGNPACQLVLRTIATEVKRGLELPRKNHGLDPISFSELDNRCLKDLRVTDPRDDKARIEQTKGGLLADSYRWVLNNDDFRRWCDDGQSRLLWIKGDPGKGKTMLLCGIINELKSTYDSCLHSFFFCQATDTSINNATGVLRGLIYLLVDQQPSLISHVQKKYDTAGNPLFRDVNAWVALSEIFTGILEDPSLPSTRLIIDALDECTQDLDLLLDLIVQTSLAYLSVKWAVSSRNWPSIEKTSDTATQKVWLSLELNEQSVSADVTTYVQFKVEGLAKRNKYNYDTRSVVERYLSTNAREYHWTSDRRPARHWLPHRVSSAETAG